MCSTGIQVVKYSTKKKESLLFGKGELFVDMSSFDTNVLSEKVPKFSMAVGQEKRVLKWKEPDEIWKELAYPLYVKKKCTRKTKKHVPRMRMGVEVCCLWIKDSVFFFLPLSRLNVFFFFA